MNLLLEPRWKSYIVESTTPVLTPAQCDDIIRIGQSQPNKDAGVGIGKPGDKNELALIKRKELLRLAGFLLVWLNLFIRLLNDGY